MSLRSPHGTTPVQGLEQFEEPPKPSAEDCPWTEPDPQSSEEECIRDPTGIYPAWGPTEAFWWCVFRQSCRCQSNCDWIRPSSWTVVSFAAQCEESCPEGSMQYDFPIWQQQHSGVSGSPHGAVRPMVCQNLCGPVKDPFPGFKQCFPHIGSPDRHCSGRCELHSNPSQNAAHVDRKEVVSDWFLWTCPPCQSDTVKSELIKGQPQETMHVEEESKSVGDEPQPSVINPCSSQPPSDPKKCSTDSNPSFRDHGLQPSCRTIPAGDIPEGQRRVHEDVIRPVVKDENRFRRGQVESEIHRCGDPRPKIHHVVCEEVQGISETCSSGVPVLQQSVCGGWSWHRKMPRSCNRPHWNWKPRPKRPDPQLWTSQVRGAGPKKRPQSRGVWFRKSMPVWWRASSRASTIASRLRRTPCTWSLNNFRYWPRPWCRQPAHRNPEWGQPWTGL